jgi:hypothetical protein
LATEAAVGPGSDIESEDIVFKPSLSLMDETMVEAMARTAMQTSQQRDYKALVWTMKSLADDVELEPFVEAIPDILWGPRGQRYVYQEHIRALIQNPDVQLLNRIMTLLDSSHAGILSPAASQRRAIACYKAFWAIACLSRPDQSSNESSISRALDLVTCIQSMFRDPANSVVPSLGQFRSILSLNSETSPYFISAWAMMQWSTFFAIKGHLFKLREFLATYEGNSNIQDGSSELEQVASSLGRIQGKFSYLLISPPPPSGNSIFQLRSLVEEYLAAIPWHITLNFLSQSARLESPPYHWDETRAIGVSGAVPASVNPWVELEISNMIPTQMDRLNSATDVTKLGWIDTCISELVSLWQPVDTSCIPRAIIVFLNRRDSDSGLKKVLLAERNTEIRLWNCFPRTLFKGASDPPIGLYNPLSIPREDSFTALWRLASLRLDDDAYNDSHLASIESVLEALSTAEFSFAHITHSIVALLKIRILIKIHSRRSKTLVEAGLNHHVFPTETAIEIPDELNNTQETDAIWDSLKMYNFRCNRISEANVYSVTEYLEHCTSDVLPYNAVQTLDKVTFYPLNSAIHGTHQLRLANSIQAIFTAARSTELLNGIVNSKHWSLYAEGPKTEEQVTEVRAHRAKADLGHFFPQLWPWLDYPIARQKIEHTFAEYEKQLMASADSLELATVARLQNILQGLKSWHAERDPMNPDDDGENEGSISDSIGGRMVRCDASASSSTEVVP